MLSVVADLLTLKLARGAEHGGQCIAASLCICAHARPLAACVLASVPSYKRQSSTAFHRLL
jgi:hypothetical protein